ALLQAAGPSAANDGARGDRSRRRLPRVARVGGHHRPGAQRGRRLRDVLVTTAELVARTRARLAARERRVVIGGPLLEAARLVPVLGRVGARAGLRSSPDP